MSGITYQDQTKVRDALDACIKVKGVTSLRDMQIFIFNRTGINPSPATISRLLKEMGYEFNMRLAWSKVR